MKQLLWVEMTDETRVAVFALSKRNGYASLRKVGNQGVSPTS